MRVLVQATSENVRVGINSSDIYLQEHFVYTQEIDVSLNVTTSYITDR